jgi:hypothetical protein
MVAQVAQLHATNLFLQAPESNTGSSLMAASHLLSLSPPPGFCEQPCLMHPISPPCCLACSHSPPTSGSHCLSCLPAVPLGSAMPHPSLLAPHTPWCALQLLPPTSPWPFLASHVTEHAMAETHAFSLLHVCHVAKASPKQCCHSILPQITAKLTTSSCLQFCPCACHHVTVQPNGARAHSLAFNDLQSTELRGSHTALLRKAPPPHPFRGCSMDTAPTCLTWR